MVAQGSYALTHGLQIAMWVQDDGLDLVELFLMFLKDFAGKETADATDSQSIDVRLKFIETTAERAGYMGGKSTILDVSFHAKKRRHLVIDGLRIRNLALLNQRNGQISVIAAYVGKICVPRHHSRHRGQSSG